MEELSPVKRALIEQRRLKARIEELERKRAEPIAIIGIGCRFPGGADSPRALWDLLASGVDAISEIPAQRWSVAACYDPDVEAPGRSATRFGGFLGEIDGFDAYHFGIAPREAALMDPQQRLLLEVSWEALEHAGRPPDSLNGSAAGVFVGISTNDYLQKQVQSQPLTTIDAYLATGNAHSVAAGRISYLLGLHGPAIAVDTACSSSLVAVHLACESIRSGACDMALAGGVGILLCLENYISLSKARMMAQDGRCKTFDAAADGFVRSEGCGMVVLKRLSTAVAAGDRIMAVIRGSACNQDGRSNGITAPNGPAQQAVLRAALANAGIAGGDVSFVETHGTGTVLGDPIEVDSLTAVLGDGRASGRPLLLGSIKTNLGHLEAAAGIAGLIKAVLALHHGAIPPNLHFKDPNPHIAWDSFPYLKVPTTLTPWDATVGKRLAGVSAFGFSGTNVHAVLESAPQASAPASQVPERTLHLLAVSTSSAPGLGAAVADLARVFAVSEAALPDLCYSVNTGRASLAHRVAFVAASLSEMLAQLAAYERGFESRQPPPLLFVFGPEAIALSETQALAQAQPAYRAAFDQCGPIGSAEHRTFAHGYALSALWGSWGVRPAATLGIGSGELAAAVTAGAASLEDALRVWAKPGHVVDYGPTHIPLFSAHFGGQVTRASYRVGGYCDAGQSGAGLAAALAAARAAGISRQLTLSAAGLERLVVMAGELFDQGVALDWRGFDQAYVRHRVDVPTFPFCRQRYWFDAVDESPASAAARVMERVIGAAERQAQQIPIDVDLSQYVSLWNELDGLTDSVVANTLCALGLFRQEGESHSAATAAQRGGIAPRYAVLLRRWLQRLARAGLLVQQGEDYDAPKPLVHQRRPACPMLETFPPLRNYLERCEQNMVEMITGSVNPLQILFADGPFDTSAFLYRDWGLVRYFNNIVAGLVEELVKSRPGKTLRVLEIGSGTGGTSSSILPLFASHRSEYWFTDLSRRFLAQAEQQFATYPFVRYEIFDVDEAPASQGIPAGYFDLVVAANSVHAARHLEHALGHAQDLLAPGGMLVLYEVTRDFDWFDMSLALMEGWQHHIDPLRAGSPLLTASRWVELLQRCGFEMVQTLPGAKSRAQVLGHHIIVAGKPCAGAGAAAAVAAVPAAPQRRRSSAPASTATGGSLLQRLEPLTAQERRELLQERVREQVMRVMGIGAEATPPGTDARLMDAGMDSLMAVELRNVLQRDLDGMKLPATLIFEHPTIQSIVALLVARLWPDHIEPSQASQGIDQAGPTPSASALAAMSDDDARELLLRKLQALTP